MKIKLHFGFIVALLVFFGTYIEQNTVANQQIVIQFSDKDISSDEAIATIDVVKNQLQSLGVEHIHIGQYRNGQLKITYYSDADVKRIQDILSNGNGLQFAYGTNGEKQSDFPISDNTETYELNISEIQKNLEVNWGLEGTEVVQLNQKSERFYNLKVNTSGNQNCSKLSDYTIRIVLKVYGNTTLTNTKNTYDFPEVRAGPNAPKNV